MASSLRALALVSLAAIGTVWLWRRRRSAQELRRAHIRRQLSEIEPGADTFSLPEVTKDEKEAPRVRNYIGWKVMVSTTALDNGCDSDALHHLAGVCELHLLCPADTPAAAAEAVSKHHAALGPFGLARHRILCHSTTAGKQAIVRQLAPTLYVDDDEATIAYLARHTPHLVQVDRAFCDDDGAARAPVVRWDVVNCVRARTLTSYMHAVMM
eukprot:PhM_4_TR4934/c1_g1_i2/m.79789